MATNRVSILRAVPEGAETSLIELRNLLIESTNSPVWPTEGAKSPYAAILDILFRFARVQAVSLLIHDGRREELMPTTVAGIETSDASPVRLNEAGGLHASVMDSLENTLRLNQPLEDSRFTRRWLEWWSAKLRPNSVLNAALVPVRGDFEFRCVLQFFNRLDETGDPDPAGFSKEDGEFLDMLAKLVTMSLSKIWMMDRIEILNEAMSELHTQSDVESLSNKVARAGARLANASSCAVFLTDPARPDFMKMQGSWGFRHSTDDLSVPREKSLVGRVAICNRIEEISDLQNARESYPNGPGKREGMVSALALPLGSSFGNGRKLDKTNIPTSGALIVYSLRRREFSQSTRNLLQQFSLSTGALLQNRVHAEVSEGLRQILILAAHSLRSPLNRISHSVHKIRKQDRAQRHSADIQAVFDNLALVNNRITTMLYSRSGIIEMAGLDVGRIELNKILADCRSRHAPKAAESGIKIRLADSVDTLPSIRGDKAKLDLVFDNILENAVKYSWRQQEILINSEHDTRAVKISITDRGLGIPESSKKKIFDSFMRSDVLDRVRYIAGTGLGLFVSKMIVDAHRGDITVKSTPFLDDPERRLNYEGYETTFTVTLPLDGGLASYGNSRSNGIG